MADKWHCEICGVDGELHRGNPNDGTLVPWYAWIVINKWTGSKVCMPCNNWLKLQEEEYLNDMRKKWLNEKIEKGLIK